MAAKPPDPRDQIERAVEAVNEAVELVIRGIAALDLATIEKARKPLKDATILIGTARELRRDGW